MAVTGWVPRSLRPEAAEPGTAFAFGIGLAMVAVATAAGSMLAPSWGNSAVDLLYLPAVLGAAIIGGLRPALFSAVVSAICFNFFFTAPRHTFRIDNPVDLVTVAILLLVATVASQLASSMRKQAQIAEAHSARDAAIAGLSGSLLASTDQLQIAEVTTHYLAAHFRCRAVWVGDSSQSRVMASAPIKVRLRKREIEAAVLSLESVRMACQSESGVEASDWQFYAVRYDQLLMATIGLGRDDGARVVSEDQLSLLYKLLDQVALTLERARLEGAAREVAALRERDRTRAAVLSTIAQDVKPWLGTITTTVADLRRASSCDKMLISTIGNETVRLEQYVAGLANLGLDADQQPIESYGVTIDLFRRIVTREGDQVHLTPKEYALLAELAKHPGRVLTHEHLLRTVWGPAQKGKTEYLRVAIRGLRQKLERDQSEPKLIINEPAIGYRLVLN